MNDKKKYLEAEQIIKEYGIINEDNSIQFLDAVYSGDESLSEIKTLHMHVINRDSKIEYPIGKGTYLVRLINRFNKTLKQLAKEGKVILKEKEKVEVPKIHGKFKYNYNVEISDNQKIKLENFMKKHQIRFDVNIGHFDEL